MRIGVSLGFMLLGSMAAALGDDGPAITVNLSNVHPTQMQVGLAAVRIVAQTNYVDAAIGPDPSLADFRSRDTGDPKNPRPPLKPLSELNPAQRALLREKIAAYLEKNPPSPVRAIRGPDGSIFITDGHHRTTALEVLTLEGAPPLVNPATAKIRVVVGDDGNFQGRPADFEKFVVEKGFFTREVRERFERKELSVRQLLARLPQSMKEMAHEDNPLRSTIGKVFFDLGIKGDPFQDYLEFFIGEQIECESGSRAGHEFDDATLERTRRAIFGNAKVLAYLRSKELPEPDKAAAEAQITKALGRYQANENDRATRGLAAPEPSACSVNAALNRAVGKQHELSPAAVEDDDVQKGHQPVPQPPAAEKPASESRTNAH